MSEKKEFKFKRTDLNSWGDVLRFIRENFDYKKHTISWFMFCSDVSISIENKKKGEE